VKVACISGLDIGRFLTKRSSIYHDFELHYSHSVVGTVVLWLYRYSATGRVQNTKSAV